MATTVISFLVRVPVLSEQMTVRLPRVCAVGVWILAGRAPPGAAVSVV